MKKIDKSNKLLDMALSNYNSHILNITLTIIFMAIGYFYYPPIIIMSCLFSIVISWTLRFKRINLLKLS